MKKLLVLLLVLSFQFASFAQKSEVYIANGKAIGGYDPVGYFNEKKPVLGKSDIMSEYQGAIWHFASESNKKLFDANPEKYSPQYGGYCAFGVSQGHKVKISPDAWAVVNDKLYLNYNQNVQKDWVKDQNELIKKADENWKTLKIE